MTSPEQQQTPTNDDEAKAPARHGLLHVTRPQAPEPLARALFVVQDRVLWPLQDRLQPVGLGPNRRLFIGGGLGAIAVVVAAAVAFSGGDGSSRQPTTQVAIEAAATQPPPTSRSTHVDPPAAKEKPKEPTLHGAVPVFEPPAAQRLRTDAGRRSNSASESQKLDASKQVEGSSASSGAKDAADAATAATTNLSSPASDTISSDPKNSKPAPSAAAARAGTAPTALPAGPPAGPAALKVARQFAKGFVVYETGGEAGKFKEAFDESATPELTRALMKRPPKQPAGVEVPRAKVVNVVAGPSQGSVYKVSVSLLRVGVTSELRLDMEKPKRGEWRVTNVLG